MTLELILFDFSRYFYASEDFFSFLLYALVQRHCSVLISLQPQILLSQALVDR